MAALTSTLIFKLLDKVSRPAKGVAKSLASITDAAKRAGRSATSVDRLNAAIARNNRALDKTRGRLVDAAAGFAVLAVAIGEPIKAAVELETVLEDIGQKLEFGQERFADFGAKVRKVSQETTQGIMEIAKGYDTLAGLGASESQADAIIRINGRAATAYRAELDDLNNAGYAAMDNLKIKPEEYSRIVDIMAQAGKDGAFELRDMAQYFPQLTAGYAGLGQSGVRAVADLSAALQITRKGAGDASSAANNLSNIIQKISSPLTMRNFAKMGVNLEREMSKAAEAGLAPLEAIIEITNRTLGGDLSKLGYLFNDAQVQQGLRPLMQNFELFKEMRDKALAASGIVLADYFRRLETAAGKMDRIRVQIQLFKVAIGASLLPALSDLVGALTPVVERLAKFAENNPRLTKTVVMVTGGLIGLKVALIGVQFAALLARGGVLALAMPFVKVGAAARAAAAANIAYQTSLAGGPLGKKGKFKAAMNGMLQAIPGFGKVFARVGPMIAKILLRVVALFSNPAGWAILIASAAMLIYKFRDKIKAAWNDHIVPFFKNAWKRCKDFIEGVDWREVGLTVIDKIAFGLGYSWGKVQEWWASAWKALINFVNNVDWAAVGVGVAIGIGNGLSFGLASRLTGKTAEKQISKAVEPAVAAAARTSFFKDAKSRAGSAFSRGEAAAKAPSQVNVAGARARGGPVRGGSTYLVGEEGPELFRAPRNGRIVPNGSAIEAVRAAGLKTASGAGAAISFNQTINFNGSPDSEAMAREVARMIGRETEMTLRSLHADIGLD